MPDPEQDQEQDAAPIHHDGDDCQPFGDSMQGSGDIDH
jgi:hypothetical protein